MLQYRNGWTHNKEIIAGGSLRTLLKITYINAVHDAAVAAASMHACELARRHRERHACRHPLLCRQLTDWVETSILLLMRQLPQQHSTTARSAAVACRFVRKHGSACCTLIGWLAVQESIKGEKDDRSFHLWEVAREDDMTDWEPDE